MLYFSKLFFYSCIAFIFGVFLASFFTPSFIFYFLFLIFGLIIFSVFYKRKLFIFSLCFLTFIFGVFWEEKFEAEIIPKPEDVHYYNEKGEFLIEGIVSKESQEKEKSIEIAVSVKKVDDKATKGKLLAFLNLGSDIKYGDRVLLKGKIETPNNFTSDFNYKDYLRAKRIYSVIFYPEVEVLERNKGNPILAKIFLIKEKLKNSAKILPPPEGAILSAITLGDKSRISRDFKEKLSISGLSHIVAISGMHIMIILEIFFLFFIWLGFWRKEATIFSILVLFLYILLIGAPASAVRAGIMGGLLYIGWAMGRLLQSSRSIVFAATIMLIFNPLILTRDVGFQLSFLATIGIIYFYPIFEKRFKVENSKIRELFCLTLAAQILCLPLLIFNFGKVPVLAPLSNILVVPLLPVLLVGGFLFLILAVIFPYIAFYFSFLIKIVFSFVVFVINFISSLPFASISFKINFIFIIGFYAFIYFLIIKKDNFQYAA